MCCYFYYLSLEQMLLYKVTCREFIYRTLKLTYFIGVMLILPLGDITSGTMDEEHAAYRLEHAPGQAGRLICLSDIWVDTHR